MALLSAAAAGGLKFLGEDSVAVANSTASATGTPTPSGLRQGPVTHLGESRAPRPQRLVIPSLDLAARVVPIDSDNRALEPPADPRIVGWWSQGVRPGQRTGTALLTAHTVHTGGGAFDDLSDLVPGDEVVVGNAEGALRFRVTGVTTYLKASLATHANEVFAQDVPGRLALVTCEDWDGTRYLSNTVVMAEPVAGNGGLTARSPVQRPNR